MHKTSLVELGEYSVNESPGTGQGSKWFSMCIQAKNMMPDYIKDHTDKWKLNANI